MEVRNCRQCGKLFNYIGGSYGNLFTNCIKKIEEKFSDVKEYIEEHKNATMVEISEACDVSTRQIEKWIREERLCFSPDSAVGIDCEMCGATIKSGRYCEKCKSKITNELGNIYKNTSAKKSMDNQYSKNAKMLYLDR